MANPAPVQTPEVVKQRNGYGFQPGVSGNPNGRPPVPKCISDQLRIIALRPDAPNASSLARALWDKGETGDTFAIREILDRVEGKVPTPIQLDSRSVSIEVAASYAEMLQFVQGGLLGPGVPGVVAGEISTDVPEETPSST